MPSLSPVEQTAASAETAPPALEIRWRGRIRRFSPDKTVRIGAGTHAHIRDEGYAGLDAAHATIRVVDGVWQLFDHSESGTRVAGERVSVWIVDGLTLARFGAGAEPLRLELEPATPRWSRSSALASGADAEDQAVAWRRHRESNSDLRIVVDGSEHVFTAGSEVTVGTLDSCEIQLATTDSSPVHLRFRFAANRWIVEPISLGSVVYSGFDRCDRPRSLRGATGIVVVDGSGVAHELTVFAPGVATARRRFSPAALKQAARAMT